MGVKVSFLEDRGDETLSRRGAAVRVPVERHHEGWRDQLRLARQSTARSNASPCELAASATVRSRCSQASTLATSSLRRRSKGLVEGAS